MLDEPELSCERHRAEGKCMYRWYLEQEAGVEARLSVVLYSLTRGENVTSAFSIFLWKRSTSFLGRELFFCSRPVY